MEATRLHGPMPDPKRRTLGPRCPLLPASLLSNLRTVSGEDLEGLGGSEAAGAEHGSKDNFVFGYL